MAPKMTPVIALRNILRDLLCQFRMHGALWRRLGFVLSYYRSYANHRRRGLSQADSRLEALGEMARLGLSSRIVRVRLPNGAQAEVDLSTASFLAKELLIDLEYGRLPQFRPHPGQTVVDVGAHQGLFTLDSALRVGPSGHVVSIEASPKNARLLEQNIFLNGLSHVKAIHTAAGDSPREDILHETNLASGGHSLSRQLIAGEREKRTPRQVRVDTLDHILELAGFNRADLIKIDVEGFCLNVLKGATKTLASRPRLVMEVEGGAEEIAKVREHVEALGYRVVAFNAILYAEV
ncbi:MAG: FkbM family methyltransferase [Elusimicrobia bacterium]|nr:FkbM family methyltransferase [Elusimicrobiota bacterium]